MFLFTKILNDSKTNECRKAKYLISFRKDSVKPNGGSFERRQTIIAEKTVAQKAKFSIEKMKTDFQRVNPTWEQIKNTRHIIQNMSDIF